MGPEGRRRHGGRRRMRRGAMADSALVLLGEQEMHGYELIAELESRTRGRWRPSPGTVYPTLSRLQEKGLVVGTESGDGKRKYALTDEGRAWLDRRDPAAPAPWDEVGEQGPGGEFRGAVAELGGQVRQIARFGTDEQRSAALEVLNKARSDLYKILAD